MEASGIMPDAFTYTTLMDSYSKSGQMLTAHQLLHEMLQKGIKPTVVTFNVLMNGFCMASGIMPNATTYNSLIKQHCTGNDMRTAIEVYRGMCREGVTPDANTYGILF
ncbi:hypothetical protein OROHE_002742 [Orobanche hederae]